ncbi:MAG: cobalamin biosynthesis protein, partial [Candidatus Omnitrophica bacterium]|nr:cobalamin biosynthesis protein [Candidatus Omnitrophota bacterium]
IGTRRGIGTKAVKEAIREAIDRIGARLDQIRLVSTIDLKKDESGLIEACGDLELPISFISKDRIKNFKGNIARSKIVKRHIGLDGVCEPCALLAGRRASLVLNKVTQNGVAIALAREDLA